MPAGGAPAAASAPPRQRPRHRESCGLLVGGRDGGRARRNRRGQCCRCSSRPPARLAAEKAVREAVRFRQLRSTLSFCRTRASTISSASSRFGEIRDLSEILCLPVAPSAPAAGGAHPLEIAPAVASAHIAARPAQGARPALSLRSGHLGVENGAKRGRGGGSAGEVTGWLSAGADAHKASSTPGRRGGLQVTSSSGSRMRAPLSARHCAGQYRPWPSLPPPCLLLASLLATVLATVSNTPAGWPGSLPGSVYRAVRTSPSLAHAWMLLAEARRPRRPPTAPQGWRLDATRQMRPHRSRRRGEVAAEAARCLLVRHARGRTLSAHSAHDEVAPSRQGAQSAWASCSKRTSNSRRTTLTSRGQERKAAAGVLSTATMGESSDAFSTLVASESASKDFTLPRQSPMRSSPRE